jgi:signal transduction histidine kinase
MAVLFTVLLSFCVILIGYFLYDFGKESYLSETEAAIDNEIENILSFTFESDKNAITAFIKKRSTLKKHPIYFYQDANGDFLAGNIENLPEKTSLIKEGVIGFVLQIDNDSRKIAAKIHTFADGSRLLIARDIDDIINKYERLKTFSIFIIIFMLMVVLISFLISNFVVSRINKITNTARQIIDTGDLSRRISTDSNWDDLSYLSETLNDLLAKVESLMIGIKQVSDNIAHDLRTPITRLRGDLEELKDKKLSGKDISKLVDEADRILNIFNSLLRIANIEKGRSIQCLYETDINIIIQDVIELYEPFALNSGITISYKNYAQPIIAADKDLLFQMLANLIDNAIKFSKENNVVNVSLKTENHKVIITIADNGIGIDENDYEKVFERFYRTDKSRNSQGSGLGLSMVKAIIEMHKGNIFLSDNNPGLRVTVTFPV